MSVCLDLYEAVLSAGAQGCWRAANNTRNELFFSGSFGKFVISFGDLPGAFFALSPDLIERLENIDGGNLRVRRCRAPIQKTLLTTCSMSINSEQRPQKA